MSTRSSTRNLFPPLDTPEHTTRRRPHVDPTLLNDFEMATDENGDNVSPARGGDLPVLDLRTMEEFTFEEMAKMFLGKYFPPSMVTKLRNEITNFCQCLDELLFEAWERYKLLIDRCPNHNMLPVTQIDTFYNGLTLGHRDTINVAAGGTFMKRRPKECYDLIKNMTTHHNDWDTSVQRSITTRSGIAYQGPTIPTTFSSPKVVEHETEVTIDTVPPTNNGSTKYVQPPVVQVKTQVPNSKPVVAPVVEPVEAPCMCTRSSSNLPVESPPNPSTSNPKRRNRKRSNQPFILEESPVDTIADQRTLAELLRAPTEAFIKVVEEICVTCGGAHPYYQCLAADSSTFPELQDNTQGYVAATVVNYNQGSGSLPSNTIANPKGELKAITTRSGIVLDGPSFPIPPPFINPEEDERIEETLTDQDLAEYTIKVPPPLVQKPKPPSQRNFVVHQKDPLHLNVHYPSRISSFSLQLPQLHLGIIYPNLID
nr:reverse transcriptase domain-containing protein [Tanacetum cinerariifolium]